MRLAKFPLLAVMAFSLVMSADLFAASPKQKLENALKKGNSRYFRSVSWQEFRKANYQGKSSVTGTLVRKHPASSLRALTGGLYNKDYHVRRVVYSSIRSLSFSKKGQAVVKSKRYRSYIKKILKHEDKHRYAKRSLGYAKKRLGKITGLKYAGQDSIEQLLQSRDYRSLAKMSPSKFRKQKGRSAIQKALRNRSAYKGRKALYTVYRAIRYRKGNKSTQRLLRSALYRGARSIPLGR